MKVKDFLKIYLALVLFLLVLIYQNDYGTLYYFTKPLLMLSLLAFFWQHHNRKTLLKNGLVALALVFSLAGDVFLMLPSSNWSFTAGLLAFAVAHLAYLLFHRGYFKMEIKPLVISLLIMAGIVLGTISQLNIPDNLETLVYGYAAILGLHLCVAFLNKAPLGWWPFFGVLLFLVSDTLLAFNHFGASSVYAAMAVILTYALAQFLIVHGILNRPERASIQTKG